MRNPYTNKSKASNLWTIPTSSRFFKSPAHCNLISYTDSYTKSSFNCKAKNTGPANKVNLKRNRSPEVRK